MKDRPCSSSTLRWLFVVMVIGWGMLSSPILRAASSPPPGGYAGTYRDDRLTVKLAAPASGSPAGNYSGIIRFKGQEYPLTAREQDGWLQGKFENDGDQFELSAKLEDKVLTFTTDGATYTLRHHAVNPLAQPARANPLAAGDNGPPPPVPATQALPPQPPEPAVEPKPAPPAVGTIRLKTAIIKDDEKMIGGEAGQILIPADWTMEGGVVWRLHPALPACFALRASSPDRSEAVEMFPTLPFVWGGDNIVAFFPPGSLYLGYEVGQPVPDPANFIRSYIVPRFRPPLAQAKITATEPLPKVAEVIAARNQVPGVVKDFRAARLRFEGGPPDKVFTEDIYEVLVLAQPRGTDVIYWGSDRTFSFRTAKGMLDARAPLFQCVVSSFQPNLKWYNRYLQLLEGIANAKLQQIQQLSVLSRYLAKTTDEINEARRQIYENQLVATERISASFRDHIGGIAVYENPFATRPVELPSGYRQVWANALGEYILTDDPDLNPNTGSTATWQRLELKR